MCVCIRVSIHSANDINMLVYFHILRIFYKSILNFVSVVDAQTTMLNRAMRACMFLHIYVYNDTRARFSVCIFCVLYCIGAVASAEQSNLWAEPNNKTNMLYINVEEENQSLFKSAFHRLDGLWLASLCICEAHTRLLILDISHQ